MRPVYQEIETVAPDANGIAEAQQTAGADDLTLDGILVVEGEAELGYPQRVGISSTGDLSGLNFTVYGYDHNGQAMQETIAGPSNDTVQTELFFTLVSRISVDGAVETDVEVGTVGVYGFPMVVVDQYLKPFQITFSVELLEGAMDASVEWTLDPVFDQEPPYVWYPSNLQNATDTYADTLVSPVSALRAVINSGVGRMRFSVQQAGIIG